MKLASFPYVVQKEILDHLSVNNLFFFSLCSKNTMNFIKETQKYQLTEIETLEYSFGLVGLSIKMISTNEPKRYCHVIGFHESKAEVDENIDTVEEVTVGELGPPIIFFRSTDKRSDLKVKYCYDSLKSITEAIHDHFYILLGDNTKYSLECCETGVTHIPMLRNIQSLTLDENAVEATEVEEFIERSTCLKFFSWMSISDKQYRLKEGSQIYKIDSIEVSVDGRVTTDVMNHFEGRRASIAFSTIADADVDQFLNAWKSGEKFQKLKVMKLCDKFCDIFEENIESSVEIEKAYSVEIKKVGKKVAYFYKNTFCELYPDGLWPTESDLYIVRDSDEHVASLALSKAGLLLRVWDMTEKEFLAKHQ